MGMIGMTETMRWFGPGDPVSLHDIKQCGVINIVTSLHDIPVGEVWSIEAIQERQKTLENMGMDWTVVESLPVHEDIKRKKGHYQRYISNYKKSIANLSQCGIYVITYNFMPVLDWVRTEHDYQNIDGTKGLRFNEIALVYFDLFLLKRPGAEKGYSKSKIDKAITYGKTLSAKDKQALCSTVLLGLPGSHVDLDFPYLRSLINSYQGMNAHQLRDNLIFFISQIAPYAETLKVKLALHPDDPPFSVLGLPRVVSTEKDISRIMGEVPLNANGLCFCTGSLGANPENDLPRIIDMCKNRIHFLHLRNIAREDVYSFREAGHVSGDIRMERVVKKILRIMNEQGAGIPMRPDHGFLHTFEDDIHFYPGYSLLGRLKGLAELRGLAIGLTEPILREEIYNKRR